MVQATVTTTDRPMARFPFHWDAETEILAGRRDPPKGTTGFTGAWELESPTGAVVILETAAGVLCGVEVVVWPDVERAALVVPHDAPAGRVSLVPPGGQTGGVLEIDAPITGAATASETTIRLGFGGTRARSVRIAENLVVDLDAHDHLVGLWFQDLPLFQQGE